MAIITCENVSKHFRRQAPAKLIRDHVSDLAHRGEEEDDRFYALRDVSFTLEQGDSLGVLGRNGAGKSTLLNMLTRLTKPDAGTLQVNGKVAALLELGAGFHADLTGRENLQLNASLIGLTRKQTEQYEKQIIDFSELADHMDETLRTYSSGMIMRLAFAVAIHLDAELLIVDEILAVGDASFQSKCVDYIRAKCRAGQSMVLVSHSPALIAQFCNKALWLHEGRVQRAGSSEEVAGAYGEFCVSGSIPAERDIPAVPAKARLKRVAR
jgi:ABC-type polysaccharide/polyol phosphate transport system ATPase subunit